MIGAEHMSCRHWAVYEKIAALLAAAQPTPVETMEDIAEEFGIFRIPDTHPHAPEEFKYAYVLSLEVPSNHRVATENETPLRFTVVKHGQPQSGFMRVLPPGGQEWVAFYALNGMHLDVLEPLVDKLLESYPGVTQQMEWQSVQYRGQQAVAQLIEVLHERNQFEKPEVELLETLAQVFLLKNVDAPNPQATAYAKALHNSALETAKLVLDRLK